jgi:mercuric ion transport protein
MQDSQHVEKGQTMTVNDAAHKKPAASVPPAISTSSNWFAAFGLVAGLGAVVASSCCVLPLGLAALGAGAGIFGGLELLAEWRVPFLSVSALAVVGGWSAWWWKRPDACVAGSSCMLPKRSRATLALLLCASAVVLAAASWGYIDPMLIKLARGR